MSVIKKILLITVLQIFLFVNVAFAKDDVVFLAMHNNYWQVWLMDANGKNARAITDSPYDKSRLSWYSNGDLLVCGNQGELVRLSLLDKSETPVKLPFKYVSDAVISPDDKYLAFSQKPKGSIYNKLWLLNVDSGEKTKIHWSAEGFQHEPVFSLDGDKLYFLSGNNDQNHDVMQYNLRTKKVKPVTFSGLYNLDVAVNNKNQLLFSSNRKGHYDIWLQDDKQIKQLTDNAALDGRPSWSVDNQRVYFESNRSGVMNIWSVDVDAKAEPVQLTHHKIGARYPLWKHKQAGAVSNAQE